MAVNHDPASINVEFAEAPQDVYFPLRHRKDLFFK